MEWVDKQTFALLSKRGKAYFKSDQEASATHLSSPTFTSGFYFSYRRADTVLYFQTYIRTYEESGCSDEQQINVRLAHFFLVISEVSQPKIDYFA